MLKTRVSVLETTTKTSILFVWVVCLKIEVKQHIKYQQKRKDNE